jgi:predicted ArsR family transcriptional regulator
MEELARVLAAVQDPTRRSILLSFYRDPESRTVAEVAEPGGVHRSVVYGHLEKLLALGYLASGWRRGQPGKPAKTYKLAAGPISFQYPARHFLMLSRILGAALQQLGTPGLASTRRRAALFGHTLASTAPNLQVALEPLRQLGDRYRIEAGKRVVIDNCIFKEACASEPKVISAVHSGLIEGIANGAGLSVRVLPRSCDMHACVFAVEPLRRRRLADDQSA